MAAESDVVRITYKELEEISRSNDERQAEDKQKQIKEEAKKKWDDEKKRKEEERKKKRPTVGLYQPPSLVRHKQELQEKDEDELNKPVEGEMGKNKLHISEENSEEEVMSSVPSSKENSVEKELETVNSGIQEMKVSSTSGRPRRSEEVRRKSKRPEIQRYVPRKVLEKQTQDLSGEGSGDWDDELSSPSPKNVHSPSPGPSQLASPIPRASTPHTPSPRKIDKIDSKNIQVTVTNDRGDIDNSANLMPVKSAECQQSDGKKSKEQTNTSRGQMGKGQNQNQGQSYSRGRGRGQRFNQRSNRGHGQTKPQVGNRGDTQMRSDNEVNVGNKSSDAHSEKQNVNKALKPSQDLYIVPSRPNTIGQEADRTDTIGSDDRKHQIEETNKQAILQRFKNPPVKNKSRSYDKLNKTENWEEDGYYPDPRNLTTMVFERSRSSEQLNLSGKNSLKPPMPRSASGGAKNVQKKYPFSGGMRKRTDSFSSDISTGTGSDWSTEDLDWDKDIDNNKIDWNEEVERELALQVQDETQKMNAWFEKQELGLSQTDDVNISNNALDRDDIMTSSTPNYSNLLQSRSNLSQEKSNTLPFAHRRKHNNKTMNEEPRGRRQDRRKGSLGFRSRDSSVSSVQSVNSVQSVQSAYSNEGRRRRRRRRKSSGGSQKMRSGSLEARNINIQVTCGGRREVKVDSGGGYGGQNPKNFTRQISNESQGKGKGKGENTWTDKGDKSRSFNRNREGHHDKERFRDNKERGFDNRDKQAYNSNERLDEPYYHNHPRENCNRDGKQNMDRQARNNRGRNRHDSGGSMHSDSHRGDSHRGGGSHRGDSRRNYRDDNRQYRNARDRNDYGQNERDYQGDKRRHDVQPSDREPRRERNEDNYDRGQRDHGRQDNRGPHDRFDQNEEFRRNDQDHRNENDPHNNSHGLIHLPPKSMTPDPVSGQSHSHRQPHHVPHDNNWGRGGGTSGRGRGRERQNSGNRQKTLFDPNNPSKPILIEQAKPKLEFKDTDSVSSSPHSPSEQHYHGPPPPQMFNRGYPAFCPPGYGGYGYNMPMPHPMMRPPVGMMPPHPGHEAIYFGYPQQFGDSSIYQDDTYARDPYYHSGMEQEQQVIGGKSRSQCRMMAEHLLRESLPMDKQLNSLIARRIGGEDTLHLIHQLRRELQVRFEQLILLDPDLANKQNVEQLLWKSVFYHLVELIRKQLPEDHEGETKIRLHKILDEGTAFYENLLDKLQSTFNFNLDMFLDPNILPPENLSRTIKLALLSTQRCMICLGDIARYREQSNDGGKVNYAKARSWYTKAQQIAPKNGRPYNQLAILALYTKRKLDAVYFYMRSLAASNPFLTARESLMSLFDEARKKAEAVEKKRMEERQKQGNMQKNRPVNQHRVEIWVKNDGTSSESKVDYNYDEDLSKLDSAELNRRFVLSFLNVHGKLFTKIGMEMFSDSCGQMLQEFNVLLKDSAISPSRMLQLMAINMFAIENTALKDESLESTCRSLLQQHSVQMGLDMFGILVDRCSRLLGVHVKSADYPGRMFSRELEELVPSVKVWTDWMICHADLWNPPPAVRDPSMGPHIDVWDSTAMLCNILKDMDTSYVKFYMDKRDGIEPVILSEDTMMSGFVPLLSTPLNNTFVDNDVEKDMARDCLRIEKLRVFGEYLCGIEPPMLAYSVESCKYYSVAPPEGYEDDDDPKQEKSHSLSEDEDIVIEGEEIVEEAVHEADDHVQHLRAKKEELKRQMQEKKTQREYRERVLEKNRHRSIEIKIRPIFLIPDTNCFIDHLPSVQKLIGDREYTIVIPLVVINELDGLAQGRKAGQYDSETHAIKVKSRAHATIEYLEQEFDKKNSHLKALTSKGSVMETISFRSEETDMAGNNDDLILSCCTYYCKDKARDYMPKDKDTPVRLYREVVLLTDDRNLRLKAHTHNVPVKDIPAFVKWSLGT